MVVIIVVGVDVNFINSVGHISQQTRGIVKLKRRGKRLKIAALHVNSCKADSISTGVRLARFCAEYFDAPFIHNRETAITYQDTYDILFVKYGILLFCDYREQLFDIYKRAKRIIAVEEDYTMGPDYRLTKLNPSLELWTNMRFRLKETPGCYLNWSKMIWEHNIPIPAPRRPSLEGLGYYGAYRPDREVYFQKYFVDAPYPVQVSTYPRNGLKFRDLDFKIQILAPFKHRRQIQGFQCVLQIEDQFSHENHSCPANRFYECLMNGVPVLFDKSVVPTFERAGYVVQPFVVDGHTEVLRALKSTTEIANLQREQWYRNYYTEFCLEYDRIVSKRFGSQYVRQGGYPII